MQEVFEALKSNDLKVVEVAFERSVCTLHCHSENQGPFQGEGRMAWAFTLLLGAVTSAAAFSPQPMLIARGEISCCSNRGLSGTSHCSRRAPSGRATLLLPFVQAGRERQSLAGGVRCTAASSSASS